MYKSMDRVTVSEAATRLGVKEQAIRKRIQRGTIHHHKDEDGRVYVYLDPYEDEAKDSTYGGTHTSTDKDIYKLVDSQQDQIDTLKRELEDWKEEARRKDTIIMTMAQRIPELEAPASQDPRDAPETATEDETGTETPASDASKPRTSWWRRFFGFAG